VKQGNNVSTRMFLVVDLGSGDGDRVPVRLLNHGRWIEIRGMIARTVSCLNLGRRSCNRWSRAVRA
jgi:hypothetical protein